MTAASTRRKSGTWRRQYYNDLTPPTLLEKRFYENNWARLFLDDGRFGRAARISFWGRDRQ